MWLAALILVFNGGSMNKVKFLSATPVVNVGDFEAALDFYKGALGFTVIFQLGRYAGLKLGDAILHLNAEGDSWASMPTSVRINIEGIDQYYESVDLDYVLKEERLNDMPFGARQFSVTDPSGNRVTFTQYYTCELYPY